MLSSPRVPWKGARATGTAVRPISGSPRSPRRRSDRGTSSLRAKGRRRTAARSRARSPCSAKSRRAPSRKWRLASARGMGPGHREFVFGVDRDALRRAPRLRAVVEGDARGAARPIAQRALRLFDLRGRERAHPSARLRRRSLFPARLFRLQDGAAVRLFEMHARRRGQAPKCPQWWNIENGEPAPASAGDQGLPGEQDGLFGIFAVPVPAPVLSFRRSRKVSCPDSDITCGPPSPTPCNPATGGRRLTT